MGTKKSIVRLNFLFSIAFGIIVGIIFPFYAHFFVVYKNSSLQQLFIISSVAAGIAVGIIAFLITRFTILRIIKMVSREMSSIAEGEADLTRRIEITSKDSIGDLINYFNSFVDKICKIIKGIRNSSTKIETVKDNLALSSDTTIETLTSCTADIELIIKRFSNFDEYIEASEEAVKNILGSINNLNSQIENQTASITESTAAVHETISSMRNVSQSAIEEKNNSQTLLETAEYGGEELRKTNDMIQSIVNDIGSMLEMTGIIENISSQTNILAMNAAIEAAHAGEFGKGFGIIAEEIRNLSESTAENSKNISEVLKKIAGRIEDTARSSESTSKAFTSINEAVKHVAEGLQKISDNAFELSEGSKEILQAMVSLDKTQIEIKDGSGEIQKGVDKIVESMADVRNLSGEILEALKGIDLGVTDITKVIVQVSDESNHLRKTIGTMNHEVTKFQVSEG